ncbi:MAG: hypothetical protein Q6353_012195 [Candidatus Sigynarchaeum springense]
MKRPRENVQAGLFCLADARSKFYYTLLSIAVVLGARMIENAMHEYAHAAVVLLSGGEVVGLPVVTPFGGFTRWNDVPASWLAAVNVAGTAASAAAMLAIFLPLYIKAKQPLARWIGYWGACVLPVNMISYWVLTPFLASAQRYDPVAFATNAAIVPPWIVGIIAAVPFAISVWWMVKATRDLQARDLADPRHFHAICLVIYYIISLGIPVVSYAGLLNERYFWGW